MIHYISNRIGYISKIENSDFAMLYIYLWLKGCFSSHFHFISTKHISWHDSTPQISGSMVMQRNLGEAVNNQYLLNNVK